MSDIWENVNSLNLRLEQQEFMQGDVFYQCQVPVFDHPNTATLHSYDLIVVSQSCDLAETQSQDPSKLITLCPLQPLLQFLDVTVDSLSNRQRERAENLRRGKHPGFHLLKNPNSDKQWESIVVRFDHIFTLPRTYLKSHAASAGNRPRLLSPYLEHYSQAFARCFMRVGLPDQHIPKFTK